MLFYGVCVHFIFYVFVYIYICEGKRFKCRVLEVIIFVAALFLFVYSRRAVTLCNNHSNSIYKKKKKVIKFSLCNKEDGNEERSERSVEER